MRTKGDEKIRPTRLGLVHQDAQEGDLICILYGCTVPVILRRDEKSDAKIEREREEEREHLKSKRNAAAIKIQRNCRAWRRRREEGRLQRQEHSSLMKKLGRLATQGQVMLSRWAEYSWQQYQLVAMSAIPLFAGLYLRTEEPKDLPRTFFSLIIVLTLVFLFFPRRHWRRMGTKIVITKRKFERSLHKPPDVEVSRFYYRFIGECYLHDMMDNEAIKWQNDNKIKHETFELR